MNAHGPMKIHDWKFEIESEQYHFYHDTKSHKIVVSSGTKHEAFVTTMAKGKEIVRFLRWLTSD